MLCSCLLLILLCFCYLLPWDTTNVQYSCVPVGNLCFVCWTMLRFLSNTVPLCMSVEHYSTHCCSFGNQNMYYFKAARHTFKNKASPLRAFSFVNSIKSVSTYLHCILYRCTKHWLRKFSPLRAVFPHGKILETRTHATRLF